MTIDADRLALSHTFKLKKFYKIGKEKVITAAK